MLFVFNKEKIKSYLVSVGTVVILLLVSIAFQNHITNKTIATSSNTVTQNNVCNAMNNDDVDDENFED